MSYAGVFEDVATGRQTIFETGLCVILNLFQDLDAEINSA